MTDAPFAPPGETASDQSAESSPSRKAPWFWIVGALVTLLALGGAVFAVVHFNSEANDARSSRAAVQSAHARAVKEGDKAVAPRKTTQQQRVAKRKIALQQSHNVEDGFEAVAGSTRPPAGPND
jgi:flagellar basal body-associated protein FliL